MTSGFKINHIFVKILIIIDKYIPLALTLKNQFIALLYHIYTHLSSEIRTVYVVCIIHCLESMGIFRQMTSYDVTTNDVINILMSSISFSRFSTSEDLGS